MTAALRTLLPARLREARAARNLTQGQLGVLSNLPNAIAEIEAGGRLPSLPSFVRICDALGVSADWMLGRGEK